MPFAPSSDCRARTGSSRSCRTTGSTAYGFIRRKTEAPRPFTLTTASSITQTGTPRRRPRHRLRQSNGRVCMVSDEVLTDDQSHYEVSLTAGQAFVAFVLLLLSLAASFAFGLMIGKGQADERLVVRKEPAVINEGSVIASRKNDSKLVDLGVGNDDFKAPVATTSSAPTE